MSFLSYLINGISLGSIYAIIALGYTMVYGIDVYKRQPEEPWRSLRIPACSAYADVLRIRMA